MPVNDVPLPHTPGTPSKYSARMRTGPYIIVRCIHHLPAAVGFGLWGHSPWPLQHHDAGKIQVGDLYSGLAIG